ncbi:MAG: D-alanyl-D-alanine carboxypeptidase/D-alanyl-D-alanine-endopeptidase [Verrucomicrobia bacterium]|nr:D-alanyl-D-alanine carboxypeptidase/D-alanyl-D-alanine-endopeptidase [Verrucomicrobiota bacterium]
MKQSITSGLAGLWLVCALALAPAETVKPPGTLAELQERLAAHVTQPHFAAGMWGVKIVSLDSGKTLFEHNAEKLFSPASNSKLYTVALALDQLGGDYRLKTSLYAAAKPGRNGTLKGDLIVYGRGDPSIHGRWHGGDVHAALAPLVAALTNAGVKRISGDLIGDTSFIQGPPYGAGWDWDDLQYYYGAEISALTINDNTFDLSIKPGEREGDPGQLALSPPTTYVILSNRTQTVAASDRRSISLYRPPGGNVVYVSGQMPLGETNYTEDVTLHNPAGLFITLLKETLARHGIKVSGKLRTMDWLDRQARPIDWDKLVELGSIESPPMRELVRNIQKPSQNLHTDLILAHVGALAQAANPPARGTSEAAGIRQLREFLDKAGVPRGDVQFEEGSGLSRNNLTTPNATIALLQFMHRHAEAETYLNALPVAGVDGTLRNRMRSTPAAGNVRAKTGTLRWANSLSGHVATAAGERLLFSIMLNRYAAGTNPSGRAEIDKLTVMLAEFNGRSN